MKTLDNYSFKLSFIQKTMEFIFDNANDIDYDEKNISFVVQKLSGEAYQIDDFSPRCTVYMLKMLLGSMSSANLREDQIRHICHGIVLEDDRVISSYDITDGTVMHMVRRLRVRTYQRRHLPMKIPMRIPFDNFSDRKIFCKFKFS